MRERRKTLTDLFLSFMKVGLFTFGGGYAMISVIRDICVERKQWLTDDEMMDVTVIAESTPGPIAINCATYVGDKLAGMAGAVVATLGIVLPSFAVIYCISMFLDHFMEYPLVMKAFLGIKAAVGLLVLDAGITMLKKMPRKAQPRMMAASAFLIMLLVNIFSWHISSVVLMLLAALVSLALSQEKARRKGGADS